MIISITGHRNPKIGGYRLPNPTYTYVCQQLEKYFRELKPEKIISGMALGTDQFAAHVAIKLGIPVVAAIPFPNQEIKWPESSQKIYHSLLKKAAEIVMVSDAPYAAIKLQKRNEWMVDQLVNSEDRLIAVFDGTRGGTYNCVEYAKSKQKSIIIINPLEAK